MIYCTIYHNSLKFVLFSCGTISDSDECKIFFTLYFFLSGYVHLLASIGTVATSPALTVQNRHKSVSVSGSRVVFFEDTSAYLTLILLTWRIG